MPEIQLFVYGSLQRGERNHARFCAGFQAVREAHVLGRLYRQTSGYPMIVVPAASVVAIGTSDYLDDARRLDEQRRTITDIPESAPTGPDAKADWEWIAGEILSFDDPVARLGPLDGLESFDPGRPSKYHRAIVPARTSEGLEWVWTYIAPDGIPATGATRMAPRWP